MVDKSLTAEIYDIQGFSVHDGPGIRTTVFLKGCPLHCMWCHSPESISFKEQLSWFEIRCIGIEKCGRCIPACPRGCISKGKQVYSLADDVYIDVVKVDRSKCIDCGACTKACASKALFMAGTKYTIQEVMDRVLKDKPYYNKSGGGVTISGGEPLAQPEFTLALLEECKNQGLHTALDTTGFVKYEYLERSLPYTDLYLYDIKHTISSRHERLTGVPNEMIIENARKLAAAGGRFQLRAIIVPGVNDVPEHIENLAKLCCDIRGAIDVVQLLPYHKMGSVKYQRLDLISPMPDIDPPSNEHMDEIKAYLESFGLPCKIH